MNAIHKEYGVGRISTETSGDGYYEFFWVERGIEWFVFCTRDEFKPAFDAYLLQAEELFKNPDSTILS